MQEILIFSIRASSAGNRRKVSSRKVDRDVVVGEGFRLPVGLKPVVGLQRTAGGQKETGKDRQRVRQVKKLRNEAEQLRRYEGQKE